MNWRIWRRSCYNLIMKYFLLIIFLAPMASLAQIQSANSHLIAWGIHGKVKQLTEYYYEKDQAYKDRHPTAKVVNNFDIAGRELEEVRTDDKKIYKTVYHYAKQRVYDTTYLNGSVSQTELEILDSTGRLSEWDFEINSPEMPPGFRSFNSKTTFKYDQMGRQIEIDDYDEGKVISKQTFLYNNKNQASEEDYISYRSSGTKTRKIVNSYNSSGLKIKQIEYESGRLNAEGAISYDNFDKNGNWLLSTAYDQYHSDPIYKDNMSKSITVREISYFK